MTRAARGIITRFHGAARFLARNLSALHLRTLHVERFGAGPKKGDGPFEAVCQRSGKTVQVGATEHLLDCLERAGIEVPFGCRGQLRDLRSGRPGGDDHPSRYGSVRRRAGGRKENAGLCLAREGDVDCGPLISMALGVHWMNSASTEYVGVKQKIIHEIRRLAAIFVYLSIFFLVFKLYTRLVLSQYHLDYFEYGLSILQAFALAKVILTAEGLRLGQRFRERPLIIPTLYSTVVFAAFAWAFAILEHLIVGLLRGKGISEALTELFDKGWPHLAAMTLVVFVAFLPFFAFREAERVLGAGKLRDLFIKGRANVEHREARDVGQ